MSLSILRVSSHVMVATVEEISVNVTSVESALDCTQREDEELKPDGLENATCTWL